MAEVLPVIGAMVWFWFWFTAGRCSSRQVDWEGSDRGWLLGILILEHVPGFKKPGCQGKRCAKGRVV